MTQEKPKLIVIEGGSQETPPPKSAIAKELEKFADNLDDSAKDLGVFKPRAGIREKRGYDHSSIQLAGLIGDQRLTPAAETLQKEMARKVEEAIAKLEEKDCEIIVMRHYEQLSNQDIARVLDLTEPAASMRYLRAIRRLRAILSDGTGDSQLN